VLIIGLGNADRGDDAAGLLVARTLREHELHAIEHTGAPIDLLDRWSGHHQVVVVDAIVSGAAPGTIRSWDARATSLHACVFRSSTHEFGLSETIELARVLNRLPNWLRVYGIEGMQFDMGSSPSPEIWRAARNVTEQICRIISGIE